MKHLSLHTIIFFGTVALLGIAPKTRAQSFDFSYAGPGVTASGIFATTPLSTANTYLINGIIGTRNGNAITLIPGNPDGSTAHASIFSYDDVLLTTGYPLDKFGLLFQTSDGIFNVYSGPLQEQSDQGVTINLSELTVTPASPSTVPEPGTIALLVGITAFGASVLRKRGK